MREMKEKSSRQKIQRHKKGVSKKDQVLGNGRPTVPNRSKGGLERIQGHNQLLHKDK